MVVGTIILLPIKMRFLFILITMCWFSLDCCVGFTTDDYKDALGKSILFFEGQRSGKLSSYQHQTWRGDSGLNDGFFANVSLVGGYYDAGDNVKFGLPMAFTTTMLAWSLIEFGYLMPQWHFENALSALGWSTDYLVQAATATPNTLYVQVGDKSLDHKCWERPEDMDTPRTVYKVTPENPGSDVAGETAAALAAASIVYNSSRPSFSSTLLTVAMKMFDFADNYRGNYSDSLGSAVCPEYCSYSGYNDELLWAASWLYKASGNSVYLNYIVKNGPDLGGDKDDFSFSWDDKGAGTKILLSKIFLIDGNDDFVGYKHSSDNYVCNLLPGATRSTAQYTPGGLLYKQEGTNLQYVTSATFLLLTYVNYLSSKDMSVECEVFTTIWDDLVSQAKKQVDYILGENPAGISYMVGFGPKYPQHIHHRGSSIPSIHDHPDHIDCQDGSYYLDSVSPNPNVHIGAVVGGPDSNDGFADDRNNFAQSEPTTYVNAPLVGALAYFYGIPQDEMSFKNQD